LSEIQNSQSPLRGYYTKFLLNFQVKTSNMTKLSPIFKNLILTNSPSMLENLGLNPLDDETIANFFQNYSAFDCFALNSGLTT